MTEEEYQKKNQELADELQEALEELCNRFLLSSAVLSYASRDNRATMFGNVWDGSYPEVKGLVELSKENFGSSKLRSLDEL